MFLALLLAFVLSNRMGATPAEAAEERQYRTPTDMKISADGRKLFVVCEGDDSLLVVEVPEGKVTGEVRVGHKPKSVAVSPDGRTLYVSNEWTDTVSEIGLDTLQVGRTLPTGWGPIGLATDATGQVLYVANSISNDISLIDLKSGREIKRLVAGRSPHYMLRSRDGTRIYVSNLLPPVAPPDQPPRAEVTVIDTATQRVAERRLLPGATQLRHLAESPAGDWVMIPLVRPKNLNPMVQVAQGWVVTHGFALLGTGNNSPEVQLLLDEFDAYYADGFGAAFTPDGRFAFVSASGAATVSMIDFPRLERLLGSLPGDEFPSLGNRLDLSSQFVRQRLPTGNEPRAVVASPDSRFVYVANRLSDSISVVEVSQEKVIRTIDLGGPKELSTLRRGEILFHDAGFCFQGQFACATCHPDDHLDGLTWDLEPDGVGRNRVDNRTLRGIAETAPFKWSAKNPDLETQCGPRVARFLFRSEGFNPDQLRDLVAFLKSIPLPPNRLLRPGGQLTPAQERGKALFADRCESCHAGPHYTGHSIRPFGVPGPYDTTKAFDVPQLERIYESAPYMHDGRSLTLEEIWTVFNPDDTHGATNNLGKDQLNDLIEYLKVL
ncbi:MAG: beta-propeller fold lactonase family protein [Dehalococcoidia bacterium]